MLTPIQNTIKLATGAMNTPTKTPIQSNLPPVQGGLNTPIVKSASLGVQPKTPVTAPVSNSLSSTQVKSPALTFNAGTLAQQHALNVENANTPGYVKLVEDGLLGPKTQSALKQYSATPTNTQTNTGTNNSGNTQNNNVDSQNTGNTTTDNSAGNNQNVSTNTGYQPNDNGLYGKLVTDLANRYSQSGEDYKNAQAEAQRIQDQQTALAQDYAQKTKNIAGTAGFLTQQNGEQGLLNNQYNTVQNALASQYSGATSRLGAANTQQQLQQGALGSAAGLSAPQFQSYNNAQFNPVTGQYGTVGGGQYGSGPTAGVNIQSVQDTQKGINQIQQNNTAVNNGLSAAINYATQAGLPANSPILAGFQNKFGSNFMTNPAVIGFNQSIKSLNDALTLLGEAPIDPNTSTPTTLQQAQQTIKSDLARKQSGYQDFINKFNSGSTNSSGGLSNANPWK